MKEKPWKEFPDGEIWMGGAESRILAFPDDSFDMAILDPPANSLYKVKGNKGMLGGSRRKPRLDGWCRKLDSLGLPDKERMKEEEHQEWIWFLVEQHLRVCRGAVWLKYKNRYVNNKLIEARDFLEFPVEADVCWDTGSTVEQNAGRFAPIVTRLLCFVGEGKHRFWDKRFNTLKNCWHMPVRNEHEDDFSHVLPRKLIKLLIQSSCPKGGTVLDLMCGRGTTARVARKHQRKWAVGDIDRKCCNHLFNKLKFEPILASSGEFEE